MTQAEEEMLFCSNQFIFYFLPIVILIYFLVPMKFKKISLLKKVNLERRFEQKWKQI